MSEIEQESPSKKAGISGWVLRRWQHLLTSKVRLIAIPFGLLMMTLMFLDVQRDSTYLLMRLAGLVLVFDLLRTRRF